MKEPRRIRSIRKKVKKQLTKLGCEVYDITSLGTADVVENVNVKNILDQIDKYMSEIESIREQIEQNAPSKLDSRE
jgi:hypothetical protein